MTGEQKLGWRKPLKARKWMLIGLGGACVVVPGIFYSVLALLRQPPLADNAAQSPAQPKAEIGQPSAESSLISSSLISYDVLELSHSLVHVIRIPATAPVTIQPLVALEGLQKVEALAQQQGAIAAINGGFFDPNNQQTTSHVTIAGEAVLNPEQNLSLMENSSISSYLPAILNRSEFRRYQCATAAGLETRYSIAPHAQLAPMNCQLVDALGAGPALVPQFRGNAEAFLDPDTGRDALGASRPNARSGIGITVDGTVVMVMVAQRPQQHQASSQPSGISLFELAEIMTDLGIEQGINLDGGSSSSLYYDGTTHYGRIDAEGNKIQRSVKSILAVIPDAAR